MTKKIYFDSKIFFLTMTKTNFFDNDKKGPATKKGFLIQSGGIVSKSELIWLPFGQFFALKNPGFTRIHHL